MQKREILLKATLEISCFNCENCVDKDEDFICKLTSEIVNDDTLSLRHILRCKDGINWKIDPKTDEGYLLEDIKILTIADAKNHLD